MDAADEAAAGYLFALVSAIEDPHAIPAQRAPREQGRGAGRHERKRQVSAFHKYLLRTFMCG